MNINFRQSQFELFPGSPGSSDEAQKPRYLFTDLTLSLENIILIGIVLLMVLIFSFSVGVEKGKRLSQNFPAGMQPVHPSKQAAAVNPAVTTQSQKNIQASPALPVNKINGSNQGPARPQVKPMAATAAEFVSQPLPAQVLQNFYTVQVASFKLDKNAQQEASFLKKKGYESLVVDKGGYLIVCVGKFVKAEEAKLFVNQFKNKHKQYKDCLVRRM